jgi:phosphate uptake regulator
VTTTGETTGMRRTFHEHLEDLRSTVIRLGALTTELIAAATQSLLDGDLTLARQAIESDDTIDALTHTV